MGSQSRSWVRAWRDGINMNINRAVNQQCVGRLSCELRITSPMKKASVSTKSPAKASSKAQGDVSSRGSVTEPSTKVQRAYSPPCTRSQTERFAKQLKFYEQLSEQRMSRHARDRPKLKAVEYGQQDDAGKHGRKQTSPTKNGQEDEASREYFS